MSSPNKKQKSEKGSIDKYLEKSDVKCPVCQKLIDKNKINQHLDKCLESGGSESEENGKKDTTTINDSFDDSLELKDNFVKITCPVCKKGVYEDEMDKHLDICLNGEGSTSGKNL